MEVAMYTVFDLQIEQEHRAKEMVRFMKHRALVTAARWNGSLSDRRLGLVQADVGAVLVGWGSRLQQRYGAAPDRGCEGLPVDCA
jgi:hypothetical protein